MAALTNSKLAGPISGANLETPALSARLHPGKKGCPMTLRAFVDILSEHGELKRIRQLVDWKIELGEITRSHRQPLLFENIKDYPGMRVLTNGLSNASSVAIAFGLLPENGRKRTIAEIRRRVAAPLKPIVVSDGPVMENVIEGTDLNLFDFPIPQWSKYDAGRYIGTWHANVTRDPETGRRNLGVYRMQVLGRTQTTVSTSTKSHLSRHFAKAEKEGRPLEMAVVIGAAEPVVMAAGSGCSLDLDEYDLACSLCGEAIPLVRCGTVNLEVPAESEIVLEGIIQPGARVQDGPYLDYAGEPAANPNAYVFNVTRVMFRNRPILRGAAVGHSAAEDQQLFSILAELDLFDFHGSRTRHWVQTKLIKRQSFRLFQAIGKTHPPAFLRRAAKHLGLVH